MSQPSKSDDVWFKEGLSFTCTQCGACCTGEEGFVWVNKEEIQKLAARLGLPEKEFRALYTLSAHGGVSLRERANGDCVFWKKNTGCTVYEDRPRQCRTWPFWNSNIDTEEEWNRTREVCPGSGQGRLFTVEEIIAQAKVIDL